MSNNNTITRADLSQAVYEQVGLSRNESADLVETVLDEVCKALERGEMVKISSFGTFQVRSKRQRIGRNPKTGEEVERHASDETQHQKKEDAGFGHAFTIPQKFREMKMRS